ncbi:methyl-accepting chemotaxis protein [Pannus brasiliensis CCIBt3594]|uniref:Methyl-accepting chemotaxis protein n=1 Tax=Pannus brasiliensis CCIBt3594 TaxID=1427578 RepID=A0AAW9QU40_9CHRO
MSILDSNKLQARILKGYAVPLGILTLFAVTIGVVLKIDSDAANDLARANRVIDNVRETVMGASRMVRSVRGAALFPKNDVYPASYATGVEQIDDATSAMGDQIHDPQQKISWEKLLKEIDARKTAGDQAMQLIKAGQVGKAMPLIAELDMTSLDKVKDAMLKRQEEILVEKERVQTMITTIAIAITLLGLFGGGVVSVILGNMIASKITDDVKKAVVEITSSASEIAATMEEQERTANLQAASVSETTTTMDELGASSRQSEEQAESAAQAAQEVLQLADNGNQSVEETVATMIDLKNKVAAIADQIVRLSEQTNQIGNISSVVSDLSQQTNMLALNASVEAVRAGEHGKGFAVVAEEIRKLADQSRQSAVNIGTLVSDIQNAINTTVMVTDEGTKTVNAGLSVTERTANAFSGVLESINNVAMNNQQIVLNIRQQGKAVQQVLQAMDSINQGAQQTAASLTQVKAGTSQLSHTAKNLEAIV